MVTVTSTERGRLRGALLLIVAALLAAILLAGVNRITATRIADNVAAERLKALRAILPPDSYDNQPHLDVAWGQSRELLGSEAPLPIYRARRGDTPVAAVLTAVATNGFAGEIRVLVAVGTDGTLSGVRVIEHTETPGLGDRIEAGKSDWIRRFTGLRTDDPLGADWILDRDGGRFDQISGATITSRAVLHAARNAVLYFAAHPDQIFSQEPAADAEPQP